MRRAALGVGFAILAVADLFGVWMVVVAIQSAVENSRREGFWFAVALFVVLWVAAVVLTWLVARRVWPSFATRFAKPS